MAGKVLYLSIVWQETYCILVLNDIRGTVSKYCVAGKVLYLSIVWQERYCILVLCGRKGTVS